MQQSSLPDDYSTPPLHVCGISPPCDSSPVPVLCISVPHLTQSPGPIHIPEARSLPLYWRGDRDSLFLFSKSKSEFWVQKFIKFKVERISFFKFKEETGSSPAMAPTINGCSMADLIMQSIKKQVEPQLTDMHELLLGALARITCLEKELNNYKADRSVPRLPSTSSSSSQLCRHWLKRRCTWKEMCRFSHGSDADSEG